MRDALRVHDFSQGFQPPPHFLKVFAIEADLAEYVLAGARTECLGYLVTCEECLSEPLITLCVKFIDAEVNYLAGKRLKSDRHGGDRCRCRLNGPYFGPR